LGLILGVNGFKAFSDFRDAVKVNRRLGTERLGKLGEVEGNVGKWESKDIFKGRKRLDRIKGKRMERRDMRGQERRDVGVGERIVVH